MLGADANAQSPEKPRPRAGESQHVVAPPLADYTDRILFGEVWERAALAPRDRSLVTISSLVAGGRAAQLTSHVKIGLDNGLKPAELAEIYAHLAFYSGWPNAVSAVNVTHEVYKAQGIGKVALPDLAPLAAPGSDSARAATVRDEVAPLAPALADYTNRVLFADLWRRAGLAPRDRSLVTIVALITHGDTDQLAFHLRLGLQNGLTREEIGEAVNHLAFYAGWPKAMAAVPEMKTVFAEAQGVGKAAEPVKHVRAGASPATAPARNFTGSVRVDTAFQSDAPARVGGARVTFDRGARTNWHSHALGQTLIILSGRGYVQDEGGKVREVGPGDVIVTAPGVKHWHGATADSAMSHFAVAERGPGENVTWLEPVSDAQYPR